MDRLRFLRGRPAGLLPVLPVLPLLPVLMGALGACTPKYTGDSEVYDQPWSHGLVTGIVGLTKLQDPDFDLQDPGSELEDSEPSTLPMIGGIVQFPFEGQRLQIGLEGGFTLGWEGDTGTILLENGTVVRVYDNDAFMCDAFGGLYLNAFLSRRARWYLGAGPMIQYASLDLDYDDQTGERDSLGEDGLGLGVYARTGIEFQFRPGSYIGLGARWIDTNVDLGGDFGDFRVEGLQFGLTVTEEL